MTAERDVLATGLWRTGRRVGRTIYALRGDTPSDGDVLIGIMDTPELAARAVADHNYLVRCPPKPGATQDDFACSGWGHWWGCDKVGSTAPQKAEG